MIWRQLGKQRHYIRSAILITKGLSAHNRVIGCGKVRVTKIDTRQIRRGREGGPGGSVEREEGGGVGDRERERERERPSLLWFCQGR